MWPRSQLCAAYVRRQDEVPADKSRCPHAALISLGTNNNNNNKSRYPRPVE